MRKSKSGITLDFMRQSYEHVSPEEFLEILESRRVDIESVDFQLPELGKSGFGKFKVEWKTPHYKMV